MSKKEEGKIWLQSVLHNHLPRNSRGCKFIVISDEASRSTALGFQVDIKPFEGRVVDQNDSWLLVKIGRAEFRIIDKAIIKTDAEIGATIHVTPYYRRRFDGKEVGAPDIKVDDMGFRSETFIIGDSDSRIPVDRKSLQSSYLSDMIEQLSKLPTNDGVRNIGNALVDAGGDNPGVVGYKDPKDEDAIAIPPSIAFRINTLKFSGVLVVEYDRSMDYYNVLLLDNGEEVERIDNVDFTSLGPTIVDLVDDGEWKFPKVTIVKAAPKARIPKAA